MHVSHSVLFNVDVEQGSIVFSGTEIELDIDGLFHISADRNCHQDNHEELEQGKELSLRTTTNLENIISLLDTYWTHIFFSKANTMSSGKGQL